MEKANTINPENIKKIIEDHKKEISKLKEDHKKEISKLKEDHAKIINDQVDALKEYDEKNKINFFAIFSKNKKLKKPGFFAGKNSSGHFVFLEKNEIDEKRNLEILLFRNKNSAKEFVKNNLQELKFLDLKIEKIEI